MPPPDLTSYILSDEVSREIFTASVLSSELPPAATQPPRPADTTPLAVLLLGQTGAGKTRTAPAWHAAMLRLRGSSPAPPLHLIADTFKTFHPSYAALQTSLTPALASAATGPDARRWLSMAADEAVRRRSDVLLESACRHPSDFVTLAERFAAGGYRVEVVVLAVPEGLSRLGIMTRFYHRLPEAGSRGLPIRLTPRRVHDDSYAGLLASAEWLDEAGGGTVDQVLVVRRRNLVVFGTEAAAGVRFARSVAEAVRMERLRPLTAEEAASATGDIERLVGIEEAAADLEEVRALLRPLLSGVCEPEGFPPLRPLVFPSPGDLKMMSDDMPRLGV